MAKVIAERPTVDGFDVVCALSTGEAHTFHFRSAPGDIQFAGERRMRDGQVRADALQCAIDRQTRFHADHHQIQRIGKTFG